MSTSPSNSTTATTTVSGPDEITNPLAGSGVDPAMKADNVEALPEVEASDAPAAEAAEREEDEEEMECGFCIFMKGGGCKDPFTAWEKCVQDAEETGEDVVDRCYEVTSILKKCMDAHADYYAPVLAAEEAASAAAAAAAATNAEARPESETKVEVIMVGKEPDNQS